MIKRTNPKFTRRFVIHNSRRSSWCQQSFSLFDFAEGWNIERRVMKSLAPSYHCSSSSNIIRCFYSTDGKQSTPVAKEGHLQKVQASYEHMQPTTRSPCSSSEESKQQWTVPKAQVLRQVDPFSKKKFLNFLQRLPSGHNHHANSSLQKNTRIEVCRQKQNEYQRQKSGGSSGQKGEEDVAPWYKSTVLIPLPEPHGALKGIGFADSSVKDAEFVAAMHAERILDACGFCLYGIGVMQKKHAMDVRKEGRQAPLPGEQPIQPLEKITLPRPLVFLSKAAGESSYSLYSFSPADVYISLEYVVEKGQDGNDEASSQEQLRSNSNVAAAQAAATSNVSGGSPPRHYSASQASLSMDRVATFTSMNRKQKLRFLRNERNKQFTPGQMPLDESEDGKYQLVNVVTNKVSQYEHTLQIPCVIDTRSKDRMEAYLSATTRRSLEDVLSCEQSSYDQASFFEVTLELPVVGSEEEMEKGTEQSEHIQSTPQQQSEHIQSTPQQQSEHIQSTPQQQSEHIQSTPQQQFDVVNSHASIGKRNAISAKGKATSREMALLLASMHAEVLLDYYGAIIFPGNNKLQKEHEMASTRLGRPWGVGKKELQNKKVPLAYPEGFLPLKELSPTFNEHYYENRRVAPLSRWEKFVFTHNKGFGRGQTVQLINATPSMTGASSSVPRGMPPSQSHQKFCEVSIPGFPSVQSAKNHLRSLHRELGSQFEEFFFLSDISDTYRATCVLPISLPIRHPCGGEFPWVGCGTGTSHTVAISLCILHSFELLNYLGVEVFCPVVGKPYSAECIQKQERYVATRRALGLFVPMKAEEEGDLGDKENMLMTSMAEETLVEKYEQEAHPMSWVNDVQQLASEDVMLLKEDEEEDEEEEDAKENLELEKQIQGKYWNGIDKKIIQENEEDKEITGECRKKATTNFSKKRAIGENVQVVKGRDSAGMPFALQHQSTSPSFLITPQEQSDLELLASTVKDFVPIDEEVVAQHVGFYHPHLQQWINNQGSGVLILPPAFLYGGKEGERDGGRRVQQLLEVLHHQQVTNPNHLFFESVLHNVGRGWNHQSTCWMHLAIPTAQISVLNPLMKTSSAAPSLATSLSTTAGEVGKVKSAEDKNIVEKNQQVQQQSPASKGNIGKSSSDNSSYTYRRLSCVSDPLSSSNRKPTSPNQQKIRRAEAPKIIPSPSSSDVVIPSQWKIVTVLGRALRPKSAERYALLHLVRTLVELQITPFPRQEALHKQHQAIMKKIFPMVSVSDQRDCVNVSFKTMNFSSPQAICRHQNCMLPLLHGSLQEAIRQQGEDSTKGRKEMNDKLQENETKDASIMTNEGDGGRREHEKDSTAMDWVKNQQTERMRKKGMFYLLPTSPAFASTDLYHYSKMCANSNRRKNAGPKT